MPSPQQYVVTRSPSQLAASPTPRGNWVGNATQANLLAQDGVTANCDAFNTGVVNTLYVENFGFDTQLPADAQITKVEVIVRDKFDGVSAGPRPGAIIRVNGVLSGAGTHEQGAGQTGTVLADFVHDITADAAATAAWGSAVWTRDMLLNGVLQIAASARATDDATVHSIISWDSIQVRVTYTGAPPGTPVTPLFSLTITTTGDGAGTVKGPGIDTGASDTTQSYPKGSQVWLSATPNAGSTFTDWTGAGTAVNEPLIVVEMNQDRVVTAEFTGQPALDELLIHTGAVLQEDLIPAGVDPLAKWISVTDPFYVGEQPGYDFASDPYIVRNTGGGDPHVPIGQGAAIPGYRRFKLSPGVQDGFDAGVVPPNGQTRTQLINNSPINTFYLSEEGEHNWHVFPIRRHGADSIPNAHVEGSVAPGNAKTSQVVQWKSWDSTGASTVILVMSEWSDGYQFVYNDKLTGEKLGWFIPCPNNVWVRFRFECLWSTSAAAARFALWGDTDGISEKRLIGPITGHRTLYPSPYNAVNFSHGPYCALDLPTTDHLVDYGAIQVCAYV